MNKANKWLVGAASATLLAGLSQLESSNTVILTPYRDVGGIPTVCDGHTGPDVIMGKKWTVEQCQVVKQKDVSSIGAKVLNCINVPISESQYNAYVSFAYNVGPQAFCNSSTVLKPLNQGMAVQSCNGLYKWVYVKGKYVQGLYNRRVFEHNWCTKDLT